jgi:hypothetical protein
MAKTVPTRRERLRGNVSRCPVLTQRGWCAGVPGMKRHLRAQNKASASTPMQPRRTPVDVSSWHEKENAAVKDSSVPSALIACRAEVVDAEAAEHRGAAAHLADHFFGAVNGPRVVHDAGLHRLLGLPGVEEHGPPRAVRAGGAATSAATHSEIVKIGAAASRMRCSAHTTAQQICSAPVTSISTPGTSSSRQAGVAL